MNPVWFNELRIVREYENEGIVASLPDPGVTINLYNGSEYCGMEIWEDKVSAQDVKRLKARRFVDLIMSGKTPTKAAKELNVELSSYQTKEEVQKAIRNVVENWTFSPEVRKLYSRALTNKIAMEQGANQDPKAAKVALEALKMIGQDDEVGWLNTKTPAGDPSTKALDPALMKLLGAGKEDVEDVTEGEEDDKTT